MGNASPGLRPSGVALMSTPQRSPGTIVPPAERAQASNACRRAGSRERTGDMILINMKVYFLQGQIIVGIVKIEVLDFQFSFGHCLYLHLMMSLPAMVMRSIKTVIIKAAAQAWACQLS